MPEMAFAHQKGKAMRFIRVVVTGLFDKFNHDLEFKSDERITIMIGPNGFGKTMVLRMVNALFNQPIRSLARIPFRKYVVYFDDNSYLTVTRSQPESQETEVGSNLELAYHDAMSVDHKFTVNSRIDPRELPFSIDTIENFVPMLDQVGPANWVYRRTGERLNLEDVLERFSNELPGIEEEFTPTLPDWLEGIRKEIPVRFIDTERLTHPLPPRHRSARTHSRSGSISAAPTVRRFSEELSKQIRETFTEYGSLSQSLDRTFPVRLVEESPNSDLTMDSLREQLADVEGRRSKLVEAGLLEQEQEGWGVLALDKVDESRRGVLAVYAQDATKKLSVFDDLYKRINALKRIANSRFLHKQVTVGPKGLGVVTSDGSRLEPEMLSSGEQHELVILYELLFRVPDNSFILIDEPELSLHSAWQEMFLSDLEEMAKISDFRVLLATHSAEIIGDRWDLTVQLMGPNSE